MPPIYRPVERVYGGGLVTCFPSLKLINDTKSSSLGYASDFVGDDLGLKILFLMPLTLFL